MFESRVNEEAGGDVRVDADVEFIKNFGVSDAVVFAWWFTCLPISDCGVVW